MSPYKRLAGLATLALASLAASTAPASASGTCANYTWKSSPKVIIHESEFLDGGGTAASLADMENAVQQVVDQFNAIGATSAKITSVTTTTDPFVYASGKQDGAIHVGFGTRQDILDANDGEDADGVTGPARASSGCSLKQADILFPDQDSSEQTSKPLMWDFGTPFGSGDARKFYDATPTDAADSTWFRPSFLHELLHAWDFHHTIGYTFMTHRLPAGFPWANRPANDSIRPLPYEVGVLRDLYPASGTRYDLATLDTWWSTPYTPDDDAGSQVDLCKPSLGGKYSQAATGSDTTSLTCGVDGTKAGSTSVCQGDKLKTRVTIANYSTKHMNITTELFFSTDEKFKDTEPDSPSWTNVGLNAESSGAFKGEYTVPLLSPGTYRPILRIVALDDAADADSVRTDWIPLLGTIKAGGVGDCPLTPVLG
jgi:hypothetical protein